MKISYVIIIILATILIAKITDGLCRKVYYGKLKIESLVQYKEGSHDKRVVKGDFTSDDRVRFTIAIYVSADDYSKLHEGDTVKCKVIKTGRQLDGYLDNGESSYENLYEEKK